MNSKPTWKPQSSNLSPWKRVRQILWRLRFIFLQAAIVGAVAWVLWPLRDATALPNPSFPSYTPEPPDRQETLVLGPTTFTPGTQGTVRVVVYDPDDGRPIPDAHVRITLAQRDLFDTGRLLFSGQTEKQGTVQAVFDVPDDAEGDLALVVDTVGRVGAQRIVHPITVRRDVRLYLMTDKPLYGPGQPIRLRLLAFDTTDALPIPERPVTFAITDARGNCIWTTTTSTSEYGLADAECALADEVNTGTYRVLATVDGAVAERAVSDERIVKVEPYTRPRFKVEIHTAKTYYRPGHSLTATVQVAYPRGKPVVDAQVTVYCLVYSQAHTSKKHEVADVQSTTVHSTTLQGVTDERGAFAFGFDLPDTLPDAEQAEQVTLSLVAEVTDKTGHVEQRAVRLPIAAQPLLIAAAAESSVLKPGIENVVYLLTTYPDGHPAQCTLALDAPDGQAEVQTNPYGLAEFRYRPAAGQPVTLTIAARDASGQEGYASLGLAVEPGEHHVLLRPERAIYQTGETMHLDMFVSGAQSVARGAVYLDVLREGQAVATYAAALTDGQAAFDVDLDLTGALLLHAYSFSEDGTMTADTRMVMVRPARELDVSARVERERYAPGETARISVRVTDARGKGVQSVLGVAVVDESMLDPQVAGGSDAGTGATYSEIGAVPFFPWLDRELSALLYRTAPFALPDGVIPVEDTDWRRTRDLAVQAAWSTVPAVELFPRYAGVVSKPRPMPEHVQRQFDAVDVARAERRQTFTWLAEKTIWALVSVSGLLWVAALVGTWRGGVLTSRFLGGSLLTGIVALLPVAGGITLLTLLGQQLFGPGAIIVLGMSWFGALLALLVYSWNRRDGWASLLSSLLVGYLALGWGLRYATGQGGVSSFNLLIAGLAALPAALLALYTFGIGLMRRQERSGAVAIFAASLLLIVTFVGAAMTDSTLVEQSELSKESYDPAKTPLQTLMPTSTPVRPTPSPTAVPPVPLVPAPPDGRPWFLETLYWDPAVPTDRQGNTVLNVPLDDTSTTWRLFALASTQQGELGMAQARVEVFEPISVDLELPRSLTVGDKLDVPITIDNALPISQTARITVMQASWFRMRERGMDVQEIEVPANGIGLLYVPLEVREWGAHTFEIAVRGNGAEKTLSRPVAVAQNGKPIVRHYSRRTDETDTYKFRVPWSAVRETERIMVKLYPGWSSIFAEGLQSALEWTGSIEWERQVIISPTQASALMEYPAQGESVTRQPVRNWPRAKAGGLFEQLVATARIHLLLQEYLSQNGQLSSDIQSQIEREAALNYQRLLSFETAANGFSAFGKVPADLVHTASGLMCLGDLAHLYPTDSTVLDRAAEWLFHRQAEDGAWRPHRMPPGWERLPRTDLPFTAFITWALVDAGYKDTPEVRLAVAHLERYLDQAQDPYTLALAIHALAAYDDAQQSHALPSAITRLAEMAEVEDELAVWHSELETFSGAVGLSADVERTALAVSALLRTDTYPELAAQGLAMLADSRDAAGTWDAPQATFWALCAFAAASAKEWPPMEATARITVDEVAAEPVVLTDDIAHVFFFDRLSKGYNDIEIEVEGDPIFYQVVGEYVLPWNQVPPPLPEEEEISLTVSYDRTSVAVGETVTVTVGVMLNRPGLAPLVVLELGLPPGLEPMMQDWDALAESGVIARYERVGEQIKAYLTDLSAEQPVRFDYRLRARFPLSVKTQPTRAFDVANPQRPAIRESIEIEVIEE